MAKSNESVSDVCSQVVSPTEPQSTGCHFGTIQYDDGTPAKALECEIHRSAVNSAEPEASKIGNSVPNETEGSEVSQSPEGPAPAENPRTPSLVEKQGDTDSNLVSQLREKISALEGNLGASKGSTPGMGFKKSSELWCQLVTSTERIKNLEQQCATLQKQVESTETRAISTSFSLGKRPESSRRSGESKKYLSRKLEEAQAQISKLQAANEEWSKIKSSEAADFEELKQQFIACATALQEQVKFNADLIVEKHRLTTDLEEKAAVENSLKKTVVDMDRDLSLCREDMSNMKATVSHLKKNLRKTCSELGEEERRNERLQSYLAEMEKSHKVEMEFLNSRLIQASNLLSTIHEKIKSDKKKSSLVRIASRVIGLKKNASSSKSFRETTSSKGVTEP